MKCEIHESEMEWVETGVEEAGGGYWYCEQCQEDEEASFESEEESFATGPDFGPWSVDEDDDPSRYCPYCGKEYEDFSDYGCPACDRRI
jgi:rubrerythrin